MEKMELLEEKIRKAVDVIRGLKEERSVLESQLRSAKDEIRRLMLKQEDPEITGRLDKLTKERLAIAERVERMITIIEAADAN
jgi:FtsZ-binding cell division protein ZapB